MNQVVMVERGNNRRQGNEENPDIGVPSPSPPSPLTSGANTSINQSHDYITYSEELPKPWLHKWKPWNFITVEPMLLLQMFAWSATGINGQSFFIETICRKEFYGNATVDCKNLTANKEAESHVQGIATYYFTYRNLIEAGLPVLFALFIGPWSDNHGSKPPMILSLIGYILSSILLYVFSMIEGLDPAVLLLASVPVALSGGVIAFILSAFRYVAAVTATKARSFRMAIAEGSWFLGSPIGLLGSAALLKSGGYELVFMVCIIVFTTALFYAIIFVKNDKPPMELNPNSHFCKDMFNIEAVKETFSAALRRRTGNRRGWIFLLLAIVYLRTFTIYGFMSVTFLYTREMFQWNAAMYSQYTTYDGIIVITGSSIVAILGMKVFKIRDSTIGVISAISYLMGGIVWTISSFTSHGWMMYLGATAQMFCGLITIVARSMISKLVSKDEVGKIYSFLASGEAAIPLIAVPIYNFIYAESFESFPGAIYMFSTCINFFIFFSFVYFCTSSWNSTIHPHEELEDDLEDVIQEN